jgi:hypothetical protein
MLVIVPVLNRVSATYALGLQASLNILEGQPALKQFSFPDQNKFR